MADIVNMHQDMSDVRKGNRMLPYTGVRLLVENDGSADDEYKDDYEITAGIVDGDGCGSVLELDAPWGTQQIANDILEQIKGYEYLPAEATNAIINPAAELGDAMVTNYVYTGLYKQNATFGHTFYSDVSAPKDEEIDHEFTYVSASERQFKRQRAWTKAEFRIASDAISAKVSKQDGDQSSFGWTLLVDGFSLYSTNKRVFYCDKTGIEVDGKITARSGYIGDGNKGFEIGNTSITNGMATLDATTNGIYLGVDGIALGGGTFKVTKAGVLTAKNGTFEGTITAKSGRIGADANGNGGFTITANKMYSGTDSISSTTAGIFLGTAGIRLYKDATNNFTVSASSGRLTSCSGMTGINDTEHTTGSYIGSDGIALGGGKFKVTSAGVLTATTGTFDGTVYANRIVFTDSNGNAVTISAANLTDGTISSGKLGAESVTEGAISGGAVTSGKIGGGAVTSGKIGSKAVSKDKTSDGVQTSLDNGDTAKATLDSLTSGSVTATWLKATNAQFTNMSTTGTLTYKNNQMQWQAITVDGTSHTFITKKS